MKKYIALLFCLGLSLALSACGISSAGEKTGTEGSPDTHLHQLSEKDNTTVHDAIGYCGNTVTTVTYRNGADGEARKVSFQSEDSVELTDLLRYLDYSGDICKCLPEYQVDTEFGVNYGVSLTEGYARYNGGQAELTKDQVKRIQEILDRHAGQTDNES